ncbi:MAG: hypothetical protein FJZ00_07980 [Candidatus Sericytochromatia bacterium]|uniref:Poly(3-hydroxyalkanoate) polymerase subunit PhaE n=1 Tax=Candidatus Tanganyikabacteria bacterium TaxID=2961651 RepID=A0A937X5C2_9BACT|nr:hypothetical protein [Candidatus Tanganyikabacteria bacterium]
MYTEAEKLWTGPIHEFLGSDFFVRWMETGREVYLAQMDLSRENLEKYWEAVRLPHKGDIARVASQVVTVENKVEAVEDSIENLKAQLNGKLGAIADLVERLEAKLEAKFDNRVASKVDAKAAPKIDMHGASAKVEKKPGSKE